MGWLLLVFPIAAFGLVVRALAELAAARACRLPLARIRVGYGRAWRTRVLASGALLELRRVPLGVAVDLTLPRRARQLVPIAAAALATYAVIAALATARIAVIGAPTGRTFLAVREVLDGYPAAGALEPGDRFVAIDGEPFVGGTSLNERIAQRGGSPVRFTIERAGELREVTVTPRRGPDRNSWLIGVRPTRELERTRELAAVVRAGTAYPIEQIRAAIHSERERSDVGGPVRIVEDFGEVPFRPFDTVFAYLTYLALAAVVLDLCRAVALVLALRRQRTAAIATR